MRKIPLMILIASLLSAAAPARAVQYDFCTLPAMSAADPDSLPMWDAATVQAQTFAAATSENVTDTPLAAYPISYVRMTAARDRERCGGMLAIGDRSSRLIGDRLADYMSRWLVKGVQECSLAPDEEIKTGICGAMRRTTTSQLASLASALEITAVYLSSHMASALIAVMYDDVFWNQEFPPATHCQRRPCGDQVLRARVAAMRAYKPFYDLNNRFLAKNIGTVIETLKDACHIRGSLASAGASVAEHLPLELLFGRIRDTSFASALTAAPAVDPDDHPMLRLDAGRYTAQQTQMREWQLPPALADAERSARELIANSLIKSSLGFVGSRGWSDLSMLPPSLNREDCPFFAEPRPSR